MSLEKYARKKIYINIIMSMLNIKSLFLTNNNRKKQGNKVETLKIL